MKHTWKKAAAGLLAMALVVGTAPANVGTGGLFGGTGITAYADETETLLTTITATAKEQASYSVENVATVSFSYTANGSSSYTNNGTTATWGWWGYGWTATVTPVEGYTITKCVFYDDANRTATDSETPFVVETTEEDKTPQVNGTPILAYQSKGITKIEVYGYATPAAPTFTNTSVSLGDDLALNFYVDGIADDTAAAEYTVNFTGACVDESSALAYNATEGKYYATTHVYAKDIDKDITATLCKGDDTVDTVEDYSISQYLSSDAFSGADEKTSALITATKDFGNASSEYFYGTGSGYSDGFDSYDPDTSAYAATFDSDAAKLSLVLDSKTAARLYVKGDDTGTESTISSTKADYPTYHEVTGLLPQNLADEQTITVGGTDYMFSALTWCNRVLNNTSASTKNVNMAKAIMAYYTAAKNYSSVDVSSVTITNAPTEDIEVGETGTLTATVSPDNATNKTVTWAVTEGEDVLSINAATGAYTALKAGTAKVTATAGGKSVTCIVTVKAAVTLAGVTLTDGMIVEPHCNVKGEDNWVQFKYVADDNKFVPNFNSYADAYSKSGGAPMQELADQWAFSTLEMHETPNGNFYLTQTGNTVHLRADDGINMNVIDLQLDFDNMTYTQSYKQWYNTVSGSFTSIKIGDTTITASQMTAN